MYKSGSNHIGWRWWIVLSAVAGNCISPTASATTQIPYVTIAGMSVYASGVALAISPAQPGIEGCSNQSGNQVWIAFSSTQPDGKSLYAAALAAYLSGHTVGFGVSGCESSGQYPLAYRVDMGP